MLKVWLEECTNRRQWGIAFQVGLLSPHTLTGSSIGARTHTHTHTEICLVQAFLSQTCLLLLRLLTSWLSSQTLAINTMAGSSGELVVFVQLFATWSLGTSLTGPSICPRCAAVHLTGRVVMSHAQRAQNVSRNVPPAWYRYKHSYT